MTSKQSLAIIGGRLESDNTAIFSKMKALSGGRIAIFATASGVPEEVGPETVEVFEQHGFHAELMPLIVDNRKEAAFDQELVERLDDLGHVFFTGGDQARIIGSLVQDGEETPVLKKLREIHQRGGLIAGSSAGAAMMSIPMIAGGVSLEALLYGVTENPEQMGMLMGKGLGFFTNGVVDQHFLERGRVGRLVVAMKHADVNFGFGVDENTAMFVSGQHIEAVGEFGVLVLDATHASLQSEGEFGGRYENILLHFLDNGDGFDLETQTLHPSAQKKPVVPSNISYTSEGHINRSVFGSYTFLELLTRLAEGTDTYRYDRATAYEPEAEREVTLHLHRPESSKSYSSLIEESRDYSVTGFQLSFSSEEMSLESRKSLQRERARYNAQKLFHSDEEISPEAQLISTGSGLLSSQSNQLLEDFAKRGITSLSVVAAASGEPRDVTRSYTQFFEKHGIQVKDLNIRESNTLYQSQNEALLQEIMSSETILFLGGSQERLVDTLLYRGENTRVLHAVIRAYRRGANIIALSGAAAALSETMITGGDSVEALCYGVSADSWLQGVILEPGFGFIRDAIVDQNLASRQRLGRLLVACAEENVRYGFGIIEHSAMVMQGDDTIGATGRYGFVLADLDKAHIKCNSRHFMLRGVKISMVRPGQTVDVRTGAIQGEAARTSSRHISLQSIIDGFLKEAAKVQRKGKELPKCRVHIAEQDHEKEYAVLNIEVMRNHAERRPLKELDVV